MGFLIMFFDYLHFGFWFWDLVFHFWVWSSEFGILIFFVFGMGFGVWNFAFGIL